MQLIGIGLLVLSHSEETYLFWDEAREDVHDEASKARVHCKRLDDSTHEQHRERTLLH